VRTKAECPSRRPNGSTSAPSPIAAQGSQPAWVTTGQSSGRLSVERKEQSAKSTQLRDNEGGASTDSREINRRRPAQASARYRGTCAANAADLAREGRRRTRVEIDCIEGKGDRRGSPLRGATGAESVFRARTPLHARQRSHGRIEPPATERVPPPWRAPGRRVRART